MTLPEDVAALLREALTEADHLSGYDDRKAFRVLAETIDNLLMPLPEGPDEGQPEGLFNAYQASGDEADLPW